MHVSWEQHMILPHCSSRGRLVPYWPSTNHRKVWRVTQVVFYRYNVQMSPESIASGADKVWDEGSLQSVPQLPSVTNIRGSVKASSGLRRQSRSSQLKGVALSSSSSSSTSSCSEVAWFHIALLRAGGHKEPPRVIVRIKEDFRDHSLCGTSVFTADHRKHIKMRMNPQ